MQCLRAGMGCNIVGEGLLCFVPLIVVVGSQKLTLRDLVAVFFEPLRPWGGNALHGWARSMRWSQKVTHLAVFLKLPWAGDVGTLRESTWECATRLGTLNSKIHSLSNFVYEIRI